MKRRKARELLLKVFYEMEIKKEFSISILKNNDEFLIDGKNQEEYLLTIAELFIQHRNAIDTMIEKQLKGWTLDRIAKVDLSILRVSVAEILHYDQIDIPTSINEAIEIAKDYSDDKAPMFINGVLDSIRKCTSGSDPDGDKKS